MSMGTATKPKFTYWMEGEIWLGYLEEYPDYHTQGANLEELKENLADIYKDLSMGMIPCIRKRCELKI